MRENENKKSGNGFGMRVAIGITLGAAFGASFGNISLGVAIGIVVGVGFHAILSVIKNRQ